MTLIYEVYPRACGGTVNNTFSNIISTGLSPRLRGNQRHPTRDWNGSGSIPAPAGEPAPMPVPYTCAEVYPRACGGTGYAASRVAPVQGLSPRLRGNRLPLPEYIRVIGSIPAPAGEPPLAHLVSPSSWVYPRACGGTTQHKQPQDMKEGLSPRLRGNLHQCCGCPTERGSIPAPAGEPIHSGLRNSLFWVYPRACGGTIGILMPVLMAYGLSPRLRGNLLSILYVLYLYRSIPAPAGEPSARICPGCQKPVYPRACGGTRATTGAPVKGGGLSPRLRGNQGYDWRSGEGRRSIPAPAGEP